MLTWTTHFAIQENSVCREASEITRHNVLLAVNVPQSKEEGQKNAHDCDEVSEVEGRVCSNTSGEDNSNYQGRGSARPIPHTSPLAVWRSGRPSPPRRLQLRLSLLGYCSIIMTLMEGDPRQNV